MSIDDFDVWFESRKVISGKESEMEAVKEMFQECWTNVLGINNLPDEQGLRKEVEYLENEIDELEDDCNSKSSQIDNMVSTIEGILSFFKNDEKSAEEKVKFAKNELTFLI